MRTSQPKPGASGKQAARARALTSRWPESGSRGATPVRRRTSSRPTRLATPKPPPILRRKAAKASGLSVRELVTLASLVEKETGTPAERPIVAAVYANRKRIGMGMQADPTVIYALQKAGKYDGNLSREDLQFDSPYNTYRHPGLPPGPIASPGLASLQAAAKPADVDYLYFVSKNDG